MNLWIEIANFQGRRCVAPYVDNNMRIKFCRIILQKLMFGYNTYFRWSKMISWNLTPFGELLGSQEVIYARNKENLVFAERFCKSCVLAVILGFWRSKMKISWNDTCDKVLGSLELIYVENETRLHFAERFCKSCVLEVIFGFWRSKMKSSWNLTHVVRF